MATARDEVFAIFPETLALPPGVTAVIMPVAYQNSVGLKYISGGSLTLIGATFTVDGIVHGSTYATSKQYLITSSEFFNTNMSGPMYLMATGTTCVAGLVRYLDSNPNPV